MNFSCPICEDGATFPAKYTCDQEDISPPMEWSDLPAGTQSLTLILDDPDAVGGATWDHWILFNIPASTTHLPENMKTVPTGAKGGKNSWGQNDYGGPCPPDNEHRYFFMLYALDTELDLPEGASKADILEAMKGHVLAREHIVCMYERPDENKRP